MLGTPRHNHGYPTVDPLKPFGHGRSCLNNHGYPTVDPVNGLTASNCTPRLPQKRLFYRSAHLLSRGQGCIEFVGRLQAARCGSQSGRQGDARQHGAGRGQAHHGKADESAPADAPTMSAAACAPRPAARCWTEALMLRKLPRSLERTHAMTRAVAGTMRPDVAIM